MRWGNESERRKSKKLIADVELKDNNWLRRHFGVKTMRMWRGQGLHLVLAGCGDCMLGCGWSMENYGDFVDSLVWRVVEGSLR